MLMCFTSKLLIGRDSLGEEKNRNLSSFFPKVFRLDKIIHACMDTSMQISPLIFSAYRYLVLLVKYTAPEEHPHNIFVDIQLEVRNF